MKTNRLISRKEARRLDLAERIRLEAEITDSKAGTAGAGISMKWSFQTYRNRVPWRRRLFSFLGDLRGKRILDLGCGYHPTPLYLAEEGAGEVFACDVSYEAVRATRQAALAAGFGERVKLFVAAGEQLPLRDGSCDLVHGEAVLHHLNLTQAAQEMRRVLAVGGRAAFKDPLGENSLLELVRDRFRSAADRPKATDAPLRFPEIKTFCKEFRRFEYYGFALLSMPLSVLGFSNASRIAWLGYRLDAVLFRIAPFLQKYCRFVVTCVEK